MLDKGVSRQTVQRLPLYMNYLKALPVGTGHISATAMAEGLGLHDVQVRKDLAAVSQGGRPKTGYETRQLVCDIQRALACQKPVAFAIVGAGHFGRALARHQGFAAYNLHPAALFDCDDTLIGREIAGLHIEAVAHIEEICRRRHIGVGVLTVPPEAAQSACNALVAAGVPAIWNFAPVHLTVPPGVLLKHEDMAASLGFLSRHLAQTATPGAVR